MSEEKKPYQLPEGWVWVKLNEICVPVERVSSIINSPDKIYYIDIKSINNKTNTIDFSNEIEWINAPSRAQQIVREGDLLFSTVRPYLKNIAYVASNHHNQIASTGFCVIRPILVDPKYIFYYIIGEQFVNSVNKLAKGTSYPAVTNSVVLNQPIPLPSIQQQKQIVEKIEELFSELDKSLESLEKTKKQLSVYKFVLLNNAFEGKLTEEWRKNNSELSGINELKAVKKRRQEIAVSKEPILGKTLPFDFELKKHTEIPSWTIAKLDKLVTIAARVGWKGLKKDEYTDSGPLFLSVYSLNHGKTVDFRQVNHITQERYEESPEIILRENDVLLCKDGAGIGKVGIVKRLPSPATINSSLLIVRGNEVFLPDFLYYLFLGPKLQKIVMDRISGSAIPHLFQRDIREFMLDVPPIEEQRQIVIDIEQHLTLVEHLEDNIHKTIQNIEVLRSSILKKAFAGDLTENENSNQSAIELLHKLKTEKEKYILKQKEQFNNRIPKARIMEKDLSIEEVLQQSEGPISAKEVWQKSKHKNDIEEFYKELKLLGSNIKEIRSETESLLTIAK